MNQERVKSSKAQKKMSFRSRVIYSLVFLSFSTLVMRLGYVQIVLGPKLTAESRYIPLSTVPVVPTRGAIYSSDGQILADSQPIFSVYMIQSAQEKSYYKQISAMLAPVFKISRKVLFERMNQNVVSPEIQIFNHATDRQISFIYEHRNQLPGIDIQLEPQRNYPMGDLAGHVLGYVGPITAQNANYYVNKLHYLYSQTVGESGIEAQYEKYLQGKPGAEAIQLNPLGVPIKRVGFYPPPTTGDTVQLTLNAALQAKAQEIVANFVQNSPLKSQIVNASAVMLNVKTGGVLSMVSYPYMDPNWFINGTVGQHYAYLTKSDALVNNVIQSPGYPGSTVKPANGLAGLESGAITPSTQIFDHGFLQIGNRIFHNWYLPGFGLINVVRAIELSDDTFFYHLGLILGDWHNNQYPKGMSYSQWVKTDFVKGINTLFSWEYRLGLGQLTGIDLPGEVPGQFFIEDTQKNYQEVPYNLQQALKSMKTKGYYPNHGAVPDLAFAAIGQSQMFTPIEMAQYVATLANNGVRLQPHLLKAIFPPKVQPNESSAKPIKVFKPVVQARLKLNPTDLKAVQKGMYEMANNPQGLLYQGGFAGSPYHAAGKTGTAQIVINGKSVLNSVTIAYAPYHDPQVAVAVMVPGGGYSTQTASHLAHQLFNAYFQLKHEYFPKAQWLNSQSILNQWNSTFAYQQPQRGVLP